MVNNLSANVAIFEDMPEALRNIEAQMNLHGHRIEAVAHTLTDAFGILRKIADNEYDPPVDVVILDGNLKPSKGTPPTFEYGQPTEASIPFVCPTIAIPTNEERRWYSRRNRDPDTSPETERRWMRRRKSEPTSSDLAVNPFGNTPSLTSRTGNADAHRIIEVITTHKLPVTVIGVGSQKIDGIDEELNLTKDHLLELGKLVTELANKKRDPTS